MKNRWLAAVILVLVSCSNIEQSPKPDNFYGDGKMADILTDLYLMEATMSSDRAAFTDLQLFPNDFIYKKYETDSLTFESNLLYYSDRVEIYETLMDKVQLRLDVLKDSVAVRQERQQLEKARNATLLDRPLKVDQDPDSLPEN